MTKQVKKKGRQKKSNSLCFKHSKDLMRSTS